MGSVFIFR